jgi:hypothetical protein
LSTTVFANICCDHSKDQNQCRKRHELLWNHFYNRIKFYCLGTVTKWNKE